MKHIFFFIFLQGWCATAFCQTGKVTGTVMDVEAKVPLELATVSVLGPDSSLITYKLSDKDGKFTIEKLPVRQKLVVHITYTGYTAYHRPIQLDAGKTDTLAVFLSLNNNDTNAVVVKAIIPIKMNGDTLEINPAAFKLKENAVAEELLNQVPGITIWSDGTITANGKKVQSLLVDGKPFMGSTDPRVATQNLPRTAIDKIQLYQEYDRNNINQQNKPQDSLLTMNIKLKENSRKGYFGKAGAGYGTTDRFESDLSFQMYNKKNFAGIGGGFNNINKNFGSLQEMFRNNTFRNSNPNLYNVGRFGTNGINKNHSIGGVYSHSFNQSSNSRQNNRISINYTKSGTDAYLTDVGMQNRSAIDNPQFIRDEGKTNNRQDNHDIGIRYVKTNSYNDNLNVNGTISNSNEKGSSTQSTEVRDTANRLQSTNNTNTQNSRRSDNESMNVNFSRSNSEDILKSFNIQFNARRGHTESEREVRSTFHSFTDMSKSTANNRHYAANNQSLNLGGMLYYPGFKRLLLGRYNLFGVDLNFTQSINYARNIDNNLVGDYDSTTKGYIANGNLSNRNEREVFEYTPTLAMAKSFSKYAETYDRYLGMQVTFLDEMKTDKNLSSFAKRNLDRSFQFPRYEGRIDYQRTKREKYQYNMNAGYTKNFEYPSVDHLYTIVDDINVYETRIGNPLLSNRTNHSISMNGNFNTLYPKSAYSINSYVNGGFRRSVNPVTDSIINDLSGKRMYYYTNGDKSENLNLNYGFNISRKLKNNSLQLMYSGQLGTGKLPNYIDGIYNTSETGNLTNQFTLQYNLGSILVVNVGQNFQRNKSRQTAQGLRAFTNNSRTTKMGMVLNYPAHFAFSSTADHVSNSNLNKPRILWNAFATYRFMKDQGELKFSAMDILKQYQNITNSVNAYGTTTRITNGLQQFYLLTFSYYPRQFGKMEIKRRGN
ncbi:carboxypeptidase regulatory-like domain-containing protein [Chitinophagaceae bacterium LB-8]|uniref:Carboxypeptidase regulatory-like domain-containing protein n=1 Tax=Paraflavisolibacter caeni TaxID=2982496 RepID=A0A9X2XYM2_9BACT|nr:carboxypeptidase regulatory-like domain-containing protein [Paraflavisolibacter caeni]MCU7551185.1 carboxypeptidase regulatory-like domain-containing protein [Paraflavisolibacter caeni]